MHSKGGHDVLGREKQIRPASRGSYEALEVHLAHVTSNTAQDQVSWAPRQVAKVNKMVSRLPSMHREKYHQALVTESDANGVVLCCMSALGHTQSST